MASMNALPSAAQMILYTDARGKVLELGAPLFGLGLPGETGTLAAQEALALAAILGDGSGANPGLGSALWQQMVTSDLKSAGGYARYDYWASRQSNLMRTLDSLVQNGLPNGMVFAAARPTDGWLTRLNGAYGVPTTPPAAGALTAVQNAAGALPPATAGAAPRVVHTLVGATDEYESLPTGEATQVALTGANNAYTYQIAGTVPAGVRKVRLYRSLFGAPAGGPYFWDQDVAVTPGAAYPAMQILQGDANLRTDFSPPSWMQCLLRPSAAALFALAFATLPQGGQVGQPLAYALNGMISPGNVALGPENSYLGVGNTPQSATFGAGLLTGVGVSSSTPGNIQTINNFQTDVQGFAGAMGLQARCTAALNGTLTPTLSYTYYDAAHGWGNLQTVSGITPTSAFNMSPMGAVLRFPIPAGQVIRSVTETGVAGTASSGAWIYEGVFPRA